MNAALHAEDVPASTPARSAACPRRTWVGSSSGLDPSAVLAPLALAGRPDLAGQPARGRPRRRRSTSPRARRGWRSAGRMTASRCGGSRPRSSRSGRGSARADAGDGRRRRPGRGPVVRSRRWRFGRCSTEALLVGFTPRPESVRGRRVPMTTTAAYQGTVPGSRPGVAGWLDRLARVPLSLHQLLFRLGVASVFLKAGWSRHRAGSRRSPCSATSTECRCSRPSWRPRSRRRFELGCSTLLILGLGTRLATLPLLGMIATIQLFVYPSAWPEHLVWGSILLFLLTRGPGVGLARPPDRAGLGGPSQARHASASAACLVSA